MNRKFFGVCAVLALVCASASGAQSTEQFVEQSTEPVAEQVVEQSTEPVAEQLVHKYRIIDVEYDITGSTRRYALELAVLIDTDTVFDSTEDLQEYVDHVRQELTNQRTIESASVVSLFLPETDGGIIPVVLHIETVDTVNIAIVPYPKYDSNSGLEFKLKVKNFNFLGLMKPLTLDFIYQMKTDTDDHVFGINFDYSLPFALSVFDAEWLNEFSFDYTLGSDSPDLGYTTGFRFSLPVHNTISLRLTAKQSVTLDTDYKDAGDDLYYTEYAQFAVPIAIANINSWTRVYFTPDIHIKYNWDGDGIQHDDLVPIAGIGYEFSSSRVNVVQNYRTGFSFSFGQNFDYEVDALDEYLQRNKLRPSLTLDQKVYYAFKYASIASRLYFTTRYIPEDTKNTVGLGGQLRGIRDDQKGVKEIGTALVFSIDIPVKILQTDWQGWGEKLFKKAMPSWLRYADFELQFSPVFDVALIHNSYVSPVRTFALQDGWYGAGLEALVYPSKFRSITVRGGFYIDAGRFLLENYLDTSWRDDKSQYEIFFGLGLQY